MIRCFYIREMYVRLLYVDCCCFIVEIEVIYIVLMK